MKESALYIHIPFCDHKCIYCDFYSIITVENSSSYLTAIKKEINHYHYIYSEDRIYSSVYFGGGTPSLMEPKNIEEIINFLRTSFLISDNVEITLETNPGTVDKSKLKEFLSLGINRLSVGVQSFDNDELKFLTRTHDRNTAIKTIEDAHTIGFENISLDLIFNLPKQTKEKWLNNLNIAVDLPITHVSAYSLIIERGTSLNKMVLDGKVRIQDGDYDAELYKTTLDFFEEKNFAQYEVSNFAKQNFECRHNNAYWHYKDYLGFGTSSHSFIDYKRWWNYSNIRLYIDKTNENGHATAGSEWLDSNQRFSEFVMLSLRSSGIDIPSFKEKFGDKWLIDKSDYLNELKDEDYIIFNDNSLKLTNKGYAVCDEILSNIL